MNIWQVTTVSRSRGAVPEANLRYVVTLAEAEKAIREATADIRGVHDREAAVPAGFTIGIHSIDVPEGSAQRVFAAALNHQGQQWPAGGVRKLWKIEHAAYSTNKVRVTVSPLGGATRMGDSSERP